MRRIVYPLVTQDSCSEDAINMVHTSSQKSFLKGGMMQRLGQRNACPLDCHTVSLMEKKDVQYACTQNSLSILLVTKGCLPTKIPNSFYLKCFHPLIILKHGRKCHTYVFASNVFTESIIVCKDGVLIPFRKRAKPTLYNFVFHC